MRINNKYDVLTPTGFCNFSGLQKLQKNKFLEILLDGGISLKCSLNHKFVVSGKEIFAHELNFFDDLETKNGKRTIVDIKVVEEDIDLFDIISVGNQNLFFANEIISHNCDTDFLSSGNTVIDPEILNRYNTSQNIMEPYEKRGYSRELWIWEPPDYTRDYIVVADVARGDGTDYSAFHVFDVESVTQVAEFKGMIPTKDFGNMLVNVATEYNTALLVIENANVGWAAIQPAIDRAYSNLYYSVKLSNFAVDTEALLEKGYDLKDKSQMVPGFTTSTRSRPMIISKMEMYLRENAVILHSKRLMDELGVFIWGPDQKPQAQRGYNDDLVLAFAIAMFVRDTALRLRQQGIELTKSTINSFSSSVLSNRHNNTFVEDPWKMQTGFGTSEDLTWLIDQR